MELLGKQNVIQSNSIVTAAEQVRPGPVLGTPPVTKLMSHRLADCSTSLHQQQEKHDLQLFDRWQVRTSSRCVEADLSLRRCSMSATHVNDDAKYGGAEPCSARYVSIAILNVICSVYVASSSLEV